MSERTLWLGIRAEARTKMLEQEVRISGLRESMRMKLVPRDPLQIDADTIFSLATDLAAARIEYLKQRETVRQASRELGEAFDG